MRLFVCPSSEAIVSSPFFTNAGESISSPRNSEVPIVVQFCEDGVVFDPEALTHSIASASEANPSIITTTEEHLFTSGDSVTISGVEGSTPAIDGTHVVTVISSKTFSIPVNVTVAGSGGTVTKMIPISLRWTVKEDQKFDGEALASLTTFTKTGRGNTTKFTGYCNYNSTGLNTLLGVNPPTTSNDVEQASCMAEILWTGGVTPGKTNWIRHFVRNDIYKGSDTGPVFVGSNFYRQAIGNGTDTVTVTFSSPRLDANWHFVGTPIIINTIDSTPLGLFVVAVSARSSSGFTAQLCGDTDSTHYSIEGVVAQD